MYANGKILAALYPFYTETARIARMMGAMLKSVWPRYYKKYKRAFAAGRWVKSDPGPYIGRVIVYKLQGRLHVDKQDAGPTACFPMGSWEKDDSGACGELLVPQLGAKFE